jgi:hypothetical protein
MWVKVVCIERFGYAVLKVALRKPSALITLVRFKSRLSNDWIAAK